MGEQHLACALASVSVTHAERTRLSSAQRGKAGALAALHLPFPCERGLQTEG